VLDELDLLSALAEALLGDMDSSRARETAARAQSLVAAFDVGRKREFALLLRVVDSPLLGLFAGAGGRRFRRASAESRRRRLALLRDSRLPSLRSGYVALHRLLASAHASDPRTWAESGYEGPPEW